MIAYISTDAACTVRTPGGTAPMRIGYIIRTSKGHVLARAGYAVRDMSGNTNGTVNRAEYLAAIHAVRHAFRLGFTQAHMTVDSQLLARQMSGAYKIRDRAIQRLARELRDLGKLVDIEIHWVKREKNTEADALAHLSVFEQIDTPDLHPNPALHQHVTNWQAALIQRYAAARPELLPSFFARIFGIDTRFYLSNVRKIMRGESYRHANLDDLPNWDTDPAAYALAVVPNPAETAPTAA